MIPGPSDSREEMGQWIEALAFLSEHRGAWLEAATDHLALLTGQDSEAEARWVRVIDKMTDLAEASRH